MNHKTYALHHFTTADWDNSEMPFDPEAYSRLKFGHDWTARKFGESLADGFFETHAAELLSQPVVVIPSPYNYVENAATIMTRYFVRRLNHHLVSANGEHVDYSIIHRKVSYTSDYGFMSAEQRSGLLANDRFYLNEGFYHGKLLVFVDDIRITGSHEVRLRQILDGSHFLRDNKAFYVYYAAMEGDCRPEIEAALNFSSIGTLSEYLQLAAEPNHHVIVRPIKFLLSRDEGEFSAFLDGCDLHVLETIYYGCLGEGYYKIPDYQRSFLMLKHKIESAGARNDTVFRAIKNGVAHA